MKWIFLCSFNKSVQENVYTFIHFWQKCIHFLYTFDKNCIHFLYIFEKCVYTFIHFWQKCIHFMSNYTLTFQTICMFLSSLDLFVLVSNIVFMFYECKMFNECLLPHTPVTLGHAYYVDKLTSPKNTDRALKKIQMKTYCFMFLLVCFSWWLLLEGFTTEHVQLRYISVNTSSEHDICYELVVLLESCYWKWVIVLGCLMGSPSCNALVCTHSHIYREHDICSEIIMLLLESSYWVIALSCLRGTPSFHACYEIVDEKCLRVNIEWLL